jgi:hypothetical protein
LFISLFISRFAHTLFALAEGKLIGCPLLWTVSFAVIPAAKATPRSAEFACSSLYANIHHAQIGHLLVFVSTDASEDLSVAVMVIGYS